MTATIESVRVRARRWFVSRTVRPRTTPRSSIEVESITISPDGSAIVARYRHRDMSAEWTARVAFVRLDHDDRKHAVWQVIDPDFPTDRRTTIDVPLGADMRRVVEAFIMRGNW